MSTKSIFADDREESTESDYLKRAIKYTVFAPYYAVALLVEGLVAGTFKLWEVNKWVAGTLWYATTLIIYLLMMATAAAVAEVVEAHVKRRLGETTPFADHIASFAGGVAYVLIVATAELFLFKSFSRFFDRFFDDIMDGVDDIIETMEDMDDDDQQTFEEIEIDSEVEDDDE